MLLAHLADLHLGYRAYARVDDAGVNVRERDVAAAFAAAVDRMLELRPDVVLVAGNVFHTARPSNTAIAVAFRQFARLADGLPATPVVVIGGNHDAPRSGEAGSILPLLAELPTVRVVDAAPQRLHFEEHDAAVLCVPHTALAERATDGGAPPPLEPDAQAATNLLVLHAVVLPAAAPDGTRQRAFGGVVLDAAAVDPRRWTYVALGHSHAVAELAPNMWYAGALERISTTPWVEPGERGFLTFDTRTGRAAFHALPGRRVVDLTPLDAAGLAPAQVDAAIEAALRGVDGGIAGRIVRLTIENVSHDLVRALDHEQIRRFRAEALHLHLELRTAPSAGEPVAAGPRARPLDEQVEAFLAGHWEVGPGVSRERLVELARVYLTRAADGG